MLNMKLSESVLKKEQSIKLSSERETALTLFTNTKYAYEILYADLPSGNEPQGPLHMPLTIRLLRLMMMMS